MKESTKSPTKPSWFQIHKKFTITLCVFVWLYFMSLFVPFISNFTLFPLYVIKCGGLPLTTLEKGIYKVYIKPGEPVYGSNLLSSAYFCTEAEAQAAGFRYEN